MVIDRKTWSAADKTLWIQRGKVTLVDLAGSESIKSTMTAGKGLLETQGINTSLLHLSNIVSQLAKDGPDEATVQHVPWRNSKVRTENVLHSIISTFLTLWVFVQITMLLMESLMNQGTTLMLANVSPSADFISETTNTLNFATKAANITGTRVKKPEVPSDLRGLQDDLANYRNRCAQLEARCAELEQENERLKKQLAGK
jgi:ATP-dependent Zn protease